MVYQIPSKNLGIPRNRERSLPDAPLLFSLFKREAKTGKRTWVRASDCSYSSVSIAYHVFSERLLKPSLTIEYQIMPIELEVSSVNKPLNRPYFVPAALRNQ